MSPFLPLWLIVILLGIVEGLTEFIPVSSTGHLILADYLLGFEQALGDKERADLFTIVIQFGAILAVGLIYREKLTGVATRSLTHGGDERRLLLCLIFAFIPAALVGLAAGGALKFYLFNPITVAGALVVGGILIIIIERLPIPASAFRTEQITYKQAFAIGIAQVFSLFPGTSRSGATIMGGLLSGLDRRTATEFSFILAFPVMLAASIYDLFRARHILDTEILTVISGGFVMSFISAWLVVRWLIRFVQSHDFTVFAIYRIIFGGLLLLFFWRTA